MRCKNRPLLSSVFLDCFCAAITRAAALQADRENGEQENQPPDYVGGHCRTERWSTVAKSLSLLNKSQLCIGSSIFLSHKCKLKAKKKKCASGHVIAADLGLYRRDSRGRERMLEEEKPSVCLAILARTQAFIYLYITITARSHAAWRIHHRSSPRIRLDLQSTQSRWAEALPCVGKQFFDWTTIMEKVKTDVRGAVSWCNLVV